MEGMYNEYFVYGMSAIGAGLAVFTNFGTGMSQGFAAAAAALATGRNPGAAAEIRTNMFLGQAFSETGGLYGLVIAIILIIVQPFPS